MTAKRRTGALAIGSAPLHPAHARAGHPGGAGVPPAPADLGDIARLSPEEALARLGTSPGGLTHADSLARRRASGPNEVVAEARQHPVVAFFLRLRNPLNVLLLVLAAVSFATGDPRAGAIIVAMVTLSVTLGFVQERRSSRAAERLRAMVHTTATVVRKGPLTKADESRALSAPIHDVPDGSRALEVPIRTLVPGDIVHLSAGDMIPADVRVLSAKELFVNQAALTGESLPVEKTLDPIPDATEPLRARNLCFTGTDVVSGSGAAVVVGTGRRTLFGAMAETIAGARPPTSFDRGVERFAWLMIRFIVVLAPLVLLINGFTKGDWLEALLFAVAVAVGLAPEMLPMLVTVNLAKGAIALSKRKVIVKRLQAIQEFGAMDVLCTDKTGTLTQDRIILRKHIDLDGNESARVLEYAYLNSRFQSGLRNLLDVAVLRDAERQEGTHIADAYREVDEIPFDFERRRMSVVVEGEGRRILICKGAVDEVYAACTTGEAGGRTFPLDESHLAGMHTISDALNADGFRVIAIAYRAVDVAQSAFGVADERDLVLLGFIAFLDPPKESAGVALSAIAAKGIAVKIVTGDNPIVTRKVCRDVGLAVERIVEGDAIDALDDAALARLAVDANVFARISPAQKARIIRCLQAAGHVVGFLGDGINDGPALKTADVGISVDTAVDIAKESADIILLEKNLLILEQGVTEGRKVFANIVKYIRMGASSNFGNILSIVGASVWLPFLPMAPLQVLTTNLLYDLSQTAIPTDNVDSEYLARPRRWEIGGLARSMLWLGPVSSVFDYATFAVLYFVLDARTVADHALFQTGWFVESLLSQTLVIHVLRTSRIPVVESRASAALAWTTAGICAVGIALPYSPLAGWLGFVPLPVSYWAFAAPIVVAYLFSAYGARTALSDFFDRWDHRRPS